MHAILSELDTQTKATVIDLWQKLYDSCGLSAIYEIATPHLTWLGAEEINYQRSSPILTQIAEQMHPMTLHTFGLGLFSGNHPTLYLPIVKSREMIALHEEIWDQIQPFSKDVKLYYSPRLWVPHITLALKDLTRENLACAMDTIGFEPIELFVSVDNIAFAEYEVEKTGNIIEKFDFDSSY